MEPSGLLDLIISLHVHVVALVCIVSKIKALYQSCSACMQCMHIVRFHLSFFHVRSESTYLVSAAEDDVDYVEKMLSFFGW